MTTYLLDTNIFSYIAASRSDAAQKEFIRRAGGRNAELCISSITEAEIRFGMAKRVVSPARKAAIENLFTHFDILPWGSEAAALYGNARAELEKRGIGFPLMDLLIGVQAAAMPHTTLVTHDAVFKTIAPVIGIAALADWATDL